MQKRGVRSALQPPAQGSPWWVFECIPLKRSWMGAKSKACARFHVLSPAGFSCALCRHGSRELGCAGIPFCNRALPDEVVSNEEKFGMQPVSACFLFI